LTRVRATAPGYARREKEVAAAGGHDVVDQRLASEAPLDGLELALDVALKAAEGEAHVELARPSMPRE
jgi:hypothetical protein